MSYEKNVESGFSATYALLPVIAQVPVIHTLWHLYSVQWSQLNKQK